MLRRTAGLFRRFSESKETIDFGFKTVAKDTKQTLVNQVFASVAGNYDVMNDLMSVGVHRLWKNQFIADLGLLYCGSQVKFLDVAGGTGDIAFRLVEKIKAEAEGLEAKKDPAHVTVLDINSAMLAVGKQRAQQYGYANMTWVEGNAEVLPFPDATFDVYTIAFGIRNVPDRLKALKEANRVLKSGGRFMCLEFSKVTNPLLSMIYDFHSFYVIPEIGHLVANDRNSYKYLVESIKCFPSQDEFADLVRQAGFESVHHKDLSMGIAAIHSGVKL